MLKQIEVLQKKICELPGNNPITYYFESMKLKTSLALLQSFLAKEKFVRFLIEESDRREREGDPLPREER